MVATIPDGMRVGQSQEGTPVYGKQADRPVLADPADPERWHRKQRAKSLGPWEHRRAQHNEERWPFPKTDDI